MNKKVIYFILLMLNFYGGAIALPNGYSKSSVTSNKTPESKVDGQNRFLNYILTYSLSADANGREHNRLYANALSLAITHSIFKQSTMSYLFGLSWGSFSDGKLEVESGKEENTLSDFYTAIGIPVYKSDIWSTVFSFGNFFPVSRRSKDEGIYSKSSFSVTSALKANKSWTFTFSNNNLYTWNRYNTSPLTGTINNLWMNKVSIDANYQINESFHVGAGLNFGLAFHLNGEYDHNSGNLLSLTYKNNLLAMSLSTINGNYFGENAIDPFTIDLYKRVIALSAVVTF